MESEIDNNIANSNREDINKKKKSLLYRKIFGYLFIIIVIFVNVISSIIIQDISSSMRPFLFTYLNYNFFIFFIPTHYIKELIKRRRLQAKQAKINQGYNIIQANTTETNIDSNIDSNINNEDKNTKLSAISFIVILNILTLFWYFGNSFYNYALSITSVTTANSLSNSAIIFLLFFKIAVFKKRCSIKKVAATSLIIAGITLMAFFDKANRTSDKKDSILGIILTLVGALCYSIYATLLKYFSKKYKSQFDIMKTIGYIGCTNLIIIPLILLIFHYTNFEVFVVPGWNEWKYLLLNVLISVLLADILLAYSITMLAPYIVSFGLCIMIPLSYLYDLFIGNFTFNLYYLFGTILILSAFGFILWESIEKYKLKRKKLDNQIEQIE